MKDGALEEVACLLEAHGEDPGNLRRLQVELDALENPPGLFKRTTARISLLAKEQWAYVMGELGESSEAMTLITRAVRSGEKLTDAEADTVREQLFDLLRVIPASMVAIANAVFPIPGSSMVTPWLLHRLGIMPSQWREAHLLSSLNAELERLQATGLESEAKALTLVVDEIVAEANAREQLARDAAALTYWDLNQNGQWDDEERAAYRGAVVEIANQLQTSAHKKQWFLLHERSVIGPMRMSVFDKEDVAPDLLVCWQGTSGWVSLHDVLEHRLES